MKDLPEGIEASLHAYCTSDSTGINIVIGLTGMKRWPEGDPDGGLFINHIPQDLADDWRLMTRAEIKAYKAEEEE